MQAGQEEYRTISAEAWNRLVRFRETHPTRRINLGDLVWEYIACGQGEGSLLILPGGLRRAETAFPQIRMFEGAYRVITPSYPPVPEIDPVVDGLVGILDREGIRRVSVLGQSYGGMVAQVLVRRHPERVERLILSSSGPLRGLRGQVFLFNLLAAVASALPGPVLKGIHRRSLQAALSIPGPERGFWRSYLKELFDHHLSRGDVLSHFQTGQDVLKRYGYAKGEKSAWEGPVLILGGEKDPVSTTGDRGALHEFFPRAEIRVIEGCGHTPAYEKPGIYAAHVLEFLAEPG